MLRQLARTGGISSLAAVLFASFAVAQASAPSSTAPWEPVARLPGGSVDAVVFDTAHPGVAFAGSDSAYIYRSTDGGASWTPVKVGTAAEGFRAIAVSPATRGTVYAYSTDNFFSGLATLYRSVDDGRTWQSLPSQPISAVGGAYFPGQGRGIAIDPTGQILVLTDAYAGILRSADGGATWTNPVARARAYGLAQDPNQRGVLWAAGLDRSTGLATVWKSTDFGATWSAQAPNAFNPSGPLQPFAFAIAIQPGTGVIFANWLGVDPNSFQQDGGMVASTDGGQTWSARDHGLLPSYNAGFASGSIAFDSAQADTIFLSTTSADPSDGRGGAFYRSRDSGKTWQPIGNSLRTLAAEGVWARPEMRGYPSAVFAGTPDLFVSTDHGNHWDRSDPGLNGGFGVSVADDDIAPGGYYAASGQDLLHSIDNGASWVRINTWNGPDNVGAFAIDRNSPHHTIYAPSLKHVWRSTNAGRSWTEVTPPATSALAFVAFVDPDRADHVYLASDGALFFSANAGRNWRTVACGFGVSAGDGLSTAKVLPARGTHGGLYLPMASGLWIADAEATSCRLAPVQPLPGGYMTSLAEIGTSPSALLVSGFPASGLPAVVRSTDAGATYQPVDSLPGVPQLGPWNLASSPHGRLGVASLAGDTIAISRDGGASWTTQPDVFYDLSAGYSFLSGTRGKMFWADLSGALYVAPDEALR